MPKKSRYSWNKEHSEIVATLAGGGCTQATISGFIGISVDTLTRRYRKELDASGDIMCASLVNKAYELAIAGDGAMIRFLLTTRFPKRFKPTESIEITSDAIRKDKFDKLIKQIDNIKDESGA